MSHGRADERGHAQDERDVEDVRPDHVAHGQVAPALERGREADDELRARRPERDDGQPDRERGDPEPERERRPAPDEALGPGREDHEAGEDEEGVDGHDASGAGRRWRRTSTPSGRTERTMTATTMRPKWSCTTGALPNTYPRRRTGPPTTRRRGRCSAQTGRTASLPSPPRTARRSGRRGRTGRARRPARRGGRRTPRSARPARAGRVGARPAARAGARRRSSRRRRGRRPRRA